MDDRHFDRLVRGLAAVGSRRGVLQRLAALPLAGALAAHFAEVREAKGRAKDKRRGRDEGRVGASNHKHKGRRRKHKKHHHRKQHKRCEAESIAHTCADLCGTVLNNCKKPVECGACVVCGDHSECGPDALCLSDGSCQPCDVTCTGTAAECGAALQAAMHDGGTVYVCPGTYQGGFSLTTGVTVIGAGEGTDPASNTILDGNNVARVVTINNGTGTVELQRLHVMRGLVTNFGGGIRHAGTTLRMRDCTVTGNAVTEITSFGGGIYTESGGALELAGCIVRGNSTGPDGRGGNIFSAAGATILTDCLIAENLGGFIFQGGGISVEGGMTTLAGSTEVRGNAAHYGGGIHVAASGTLVIEETCRVTRNGAVAGQGGGVFNAGGTVTLQGAAPSPIVVDNCQENCVGDVPKCAPGGSCT
jgi:hypothetical protein